LELLENIINPTLTNIISKINWYPNRTELLRICTTCAWVFGSNFSRSLDWKERRYWMASSVLRFVFIGFLFVT